MAALRGSRGYIKLSSTTICDITSWSVNLTIERPDVTPITANFTEYSSGKISGSGSFTTYDQNVGGVFWEEYFAPQQLSLYTEAGVVVSGQAHVTSTDIINTVGDLTEFTYNFVFTGTITIGLF